jgi:DNA-binding CsgD family transcriptional regulator
LIGTIYDCAINPARWEETLADILKLMSCEAAMLYCNDLREERPLLNKSVGWSAATLAERQKHIPEIQARLNEWFVTEPPLDAAFVASRQLQPDYLASAPYVQDCLKPIGIVDVLHQPLLRTPTHFSELVVARHQRQGIVTDREIDLVRLLLPHLRRAVSINNLLAAHSAERADLLSLTLTEKTDYLRDRFGLTHAEARVALAALTGKPRCAIAADLNLAEATVRAHLNHIFAKTGARRQAELIQLVMRDRVIARGTEIAA